MPEDHQQYLNKTFIRHEFAEQIRAYGVYALRWLAEVLGTVRALAERYKTPQDRQLVRQFMSMEEIVRNFLEPKVKGQLHPRVVILALEESELFREHSVLVKVMNNSVFSAMRYSKNKQVFEEVCRMESKLAQLKANKHHLDAHAREI